MKEAYQVSVKFNGGESRRTPGTAVDYMLARLNGLELYVELPALDDDECGNYAELRGLMIEQARDAGYDASVLCFPYDD